MKLFGLILLILLVIGGGIYWYSLERPQGKVFSAATDFNTENISGADLISFVSDQDGNDEIYLTDEEGSFFQRVTHTSQKEFGPELSLSSNQLAYFSEESDYINIWLFSLATSKKQLLSITRAIPRLLRFSPDGHWLALLEDAKDLSESGDLFIISTRDGKTERVDSEVENLDWTVDSKSILYTKKGSDSIKETKILVRSIDEQEALTSTEELLTGGVAPLFLSTSRKILFLDVTEKFLSLVSMSLRGEGQKELFKIKIGPQENTRYVLDANSNEEQIVLQIFSEKVLLESLIISLKEQTVKTLDLEARKLRWGEDEKIIFTAKDQNENLQLWIKEHPDSDPYQLTTKMNNWL